MKDLHSAQRLRDALRASEQSDEWQHIVILNSLTLRTALFNSSPLGLTRSLLQIKTDYDALVCEVFDHWCTHGEKRLQELWRALVRKYEHDRQGQKFRNLDDSSVYNRLAPLAEYDDELHGDDFDYDSDEEEDGANDQRLMMMTSFTLLPSMNVHAGGGESKEDGYAATSSTGTLLRHQRSYDYTAGEDELEAREEDLDDVDEDEWERLLEGRVNAAANQLLYLSPRGKFHLSSGNQALLDRVLGDIIGDWLGTGSIWDMSPKRRLDMLEMIQELLALEVEDAIDRYLRHLGTIRRSLEELRVATWLRGCSEVPIIGMTSTFAAQHLGLIRALKPCAVLVEEAGELKECEVMSAIASPRLEHLVQIGEPCTRPPCIVVSRCIVNGA